MSKRGFENLEIYRLSEKVADEVWDLAGRWKNFAKDTVGKQLVRAADSVGANIAEGEGINRLKPLLNELAPRLNAYLRSIERRARGKAKVAGSK